MKTAIYIEDGTVQLVITPESKFEKNALTTFRENSLSAKLFVGTFYDCRGGWIRQTALQSFTSGLRRDDKEDESLIIRIDEQPPLPEKKLGKK